MDQKTITGQAFRVLTDAANGVFHRISFWTHANDVEMNSGNTLTEDMDNKYNVESSSVQVITNLNDLQMNSCGCFTVDKDVSAIIVDSIRLFTANRYMYFAYSALDGHHKVVLIIDIQDRTQSGEYGGTPLYVMRWIPTMGWRASLISSSAELNRLQQVLEGEISVLNQTKLGCKTERISVTSSLDDVPSNTSGTLIITQSNTLGHHDDVANITTYILAGEYVYFSVEDERGHKSIVMFSNSKGESDLRIGGGYVCTNTGMIGSPWIITRIISPTDFSTDETGLREQIVASLTGQLWPVGSIYINLTRQNPGEFLGGTWNLITEGILTAIKGSPEQAGYHQRDLYKAVRDEDRGEHLYGVFAWQRIA